MRSRRSRLVLELKVKVNNILSDFLDYVRCMEMAVARFLDLGRFAMAAKHVASLAEVFETQIVDLDKAIKYYEQVPEQDHSSCNIARPRTTTRARMRPAAAIRLCRR